jgi:hypothetical protein
VRGIIQKRIKLEDLDKTNRPSPRRVELEELHKRYDPARTMTERDMVGLLGACGVFGERMQRDGCTARYQAKRSMSKQAVASLGFLAGSVHPLLDSSGRQLTPKYIVNK